MTKNNTINMYDASRDYKKHKNDIRLSTKKVMESGIFIGGPFVTELEIKLANFANVKHCISVANGTDALQIALMALNIGNNDEVITVAHTWISTSEAIALLGAIPVFVDIEPDTFNIDISKIEAAITNKTKAILPVSIYGQMPDYDLINQIANKHNIPVIEDAAQSFGAMLNGKYSCSTTTIATTSFFPTKPLGCYGDGGACFTNDDNIAAKIRAIKNHGALERFHHNYIGVNSRLDALQAAILLVKLKNFDKCIIDRNLCANKYTELLKNCKNIILPKTISNRTHVWAQYSIIMPNNNIRNKMVDELKKFNINVAIFYPQPLHYQNCFAYLGYKKGDLPVTENICDNIINLPCYGELTENEIIYICDCFKNILTFIN